MKGKSTDPAKLFATVTFILTLSIASERLVEIIKGFFPSLNTEDVDPVKESRRRSYLQSLAVVSGIATAYLASPYIPPDFAKPDDGWRILGLGLLASGGSGFWNSVLTYVTKVKDIKTMEAETAKVTTAIAKAQQPVPPAPAPGN